jgi:hypothetical protein
MESYIIAKVESIQCSLIIYLPSPGDAGLHKKLIVKLHKSVEKLGYGPDIRLVTGKSRIQACDPL